MENQSEKNNQQKNLAAKKVNTRNAWIIVIVVAVIGIGVFGYSAFFTEKEKASAPTGEVKGELTNQNSYSVGQNPTVNMNPAEKAQAEIRDKKRLEDIRRLQAALAAYFKDKQQYPEALADLLTKYIQNIPANPSPGGMPYSYTPIGTEPHGFYDLVYVLETSIEGLEPGLHDATPNGIAQP